MFKNILTAAVLISSVACETLKDYRDTQTYFLHPALKSEMFCSRKLEDIKRFVDCGNITLENLNIDRIAVNDASLVFDYLIHRKLDEEFNLWDTFLTANFKDFPNKNDYIKFDNKNCKFRIYTENNPIYIFSVTKTELDRTLDFLKKLFDKPILFNVLLAKERGYKDMYDLIEKISIFASDPKVRFLLYILEKYDNNKNYQKLITREDNLDLVFFNKHDDDYLLAIYHVIKNGLFLKWFEEKINIIAPPTDEENSAYKLKKRLRISNYFRKYREIHSLREFMTFSMKELDFDEFNKRILAEPRQDDDYATRVRFFIEKITHTYYLKKNNHKP